MAHGAFDKAQLRREIAVDQRRQARETIRELRRRIKVALATRREVAQGIKDRCMALRIEVRAKIKFLRDRARKELNAIVARERRIAWEACKAIKHEARKAFADKVFRAREELAAERGYQAELYRIEQSNKQREREHKHASYLLRRSESDDEVRQNIPADLHALFNSIKGKIKGTRLKSRTEAFLHHVHENPDAQMEAVEHEAIRELRRLEREHAAEVKSQRRYMRREPLAAIPF